MVSTAQLNTTLTDDEFDRLADLLAQMGEGAMSVEELDGFFVALVSGPSNVPPSEYLPHVWGGVRV